MNGILLAVAPKGAATALPLPVAPPIAVPVKTALALNHPFLTHFIAGVFVFAAIAFIILIAIQTTKQEGLSGTIGGRVESAYRGRLGVEENLKRVTTFVAIVMVLFATMLSMTGI